MRSFVSFLGFLGESPDCFSFFDVTVVPCSSPPSSIEKSSGSIGVWAADLRNVFALLIRFGMKEEGEVGVEAEGASSGTEEAKTADFFLFTVPRERSGMEREEGGGADVEEEGEGGGCVCRSCTALLGMTVGTAGGPRDIGFVS